MKTIVTASGAFPTGNEIADAVTAYGLALARVRELDVIDIPYVTHDGEIHRAQLRVGWLVETYVTSDEQVVDELIEADTIFDVMAKTRAISKSIDPGRPGPSTAAWNETNWEDVI